jgi:DSF synthase
MLPLASPGPQIRSQHSQLHVEFDEETGILWERMAPNARPCYNEPLLKEILEFERRLESGVFADRGGLHEIVAVVFASAVPGVYNLGGDLATFVDCIQRKDREALHRYARLCIDNIWQRYQHFNRESLVTIALIQGRAYGGGLEGALPADFIIAEKGVRIALPESTFNLFPGMGAQSFLSRKLGEGLANKIIFSGQAYTSEEMYEMNVVDFLCEAGEGEAFVEQFVRQTRRKARTLTSLRRARRFINPVSHEELIHVVDVWVDACLEAGPNELKLMKRYAEGQSALSASSRQVNGDLVTSAATEAIRKAAVK